MRVLFIGPSQVREHQRAALCEQLGTDITLDDIDRVGPFSLEEIVAQAHRGYDVIVAHSVRPDVLASAYALVDPLPSIWLRSAWTEAKTHRGDRETRFIGYDQLAA